MSYKSPRKKTNLGHFYQEMYDIIGPMYNTIRQTLMYFQQSSELV
jgi:hypothetical protein